MQSSETPSRSSSETVAVRGETGYKEFMVYVPTKRQAEIIASNEELEHRADLLGVKHLPAGSARFGRFGDDDPETHERLSREALAASQQRTSVPVATPHGLK